MACIRLAYEQIGQLGSAWRNFAAVARLAHLAGKTGREQANEEVDATEISVG